MWMMMQRLQLMGYGKAYSRRTDMAAILLSWM